MSKKMLKTLNRYQQTRLKLRNGIPLGHKDVSGKVAHQFRATLVGNRAEKEDAEVTKTHVFGIDIPSEILQDSSVFNLEEMACYDFVLNGVGPGSITNAVLNLQLRGYELFSSAKNAKFAAIKQGTADAAQYPEETCSVAKVYPLIAEKIQPDATVAGVVALSQKKIETRTDTTESKLLEGVSVSVENALSWLLNTSGRMFLEHPPEGDPIVIKELSKAHDYRSRIHGKLTSWESNYKNSLTKLYDELVKTIKTLHSQESAAHDLLGSNISLFHDIQKILTRYLNLCQKAAGLFSEVISEKEAAEFLNYHEVVFEPAVKKYHASVRSVINNTKKDLRSNKKSNKEILAIVDKLNKDYSIPKLPRLKKLGGPSGAPGAKIQEKLKELNEKTKQFFTTLSEAPSIADISKMVEGQQWRSYGDLPNDKNKSDEGRFRRNLDDLARIAFGNQALAPRVYPLIAAFLGGNPENKKTFLQGLLFGIKPVWNKERKELKNIREHRALGKLVYRHEEQDVAPYAFFEGNSFQLELSAIAQIDSIAVACRKQVNQKSRNTNDLKLHTSSFVAMIAAKMRSAAWRFGLAQKFITDPQKLNEYEQSRILLGRLFVDIENLLASLSPSSGEIAYTFVYNSPIGEATKSIQISPYLLDGSLKKSNWVFSEKIAPNFYSEINSKTTNNASFIEELTKRHSKIKKSILYFPPVSPNKPSENVENNEKALRKYEEKLATYNKKLALVATESQKEILDAMWKVPHELSIGLPNCLQASKDKEYRFRLKGVSSQKTSLAKAVARKQELSDGSFVFNVSVKAGLVFNHETLSFTPTEDYAGKIISATYNLPTKYESESFVHKQHVQTNFSRMLAVDLNANGIGVALFDKVDLGEGKSTFKRIPVDTHAQNGVLSHTIDIGGKKSSFQVFHEIPELALLKDKVSFYRKNQQKTRKFGSFLDPRMEQYKQMVIARIRKVIEQLMFEYNVGYLAFENEVSGLETGAAQLRTVYKSIVNYYLWPENDARKSQKKAYWQGLSSAPALTGERGRVLKFHPGQGITAAGTSQTCSTCGQNPIKKMYDEKFGIYLEEGSGQAATYRIKNEAGICFVTIPADPSTLPKLLSKLLSNKGDGATAKYAESYLGKLLSDADKKDVISSFKTKFMRTDINGDSPSGQKRSKQSRYVCYNPDCKDHGKAQDADHNAANNIGQRLIEKLAKAKSHSEDFWEAMQDWLNSDQINQICTFFGGSVKKDEELPLAERFYVSSNEVKLKEDTPDVVFDSILWALSKAGLNMAENANGEGIKVVKAVNKKSAKKS